MFEEAVAVPPDAFSTGDRVLGVLDQCRHEANAAQARLVHAARDVWDARLCAADPRVDDAETVTRAATAEVAVMLGVSHATARTMIDTGQVLRWRLPLIDAAFREGDLDYPKARIIAQILTDAGDDTIAAVQPEVLAAAAYLAPAGLRAAVWQAWLRAAPEEAAAVRARRQRTDRTAYVRRGDNGMSWLTACLTDLEGDEAARLIDELVATVCAADPRGKPELRADALMALLHGENQLGCRCGGPDCARAQAAASPRRGPLLQILVDIETLLGLTDTPAVLPDGTPLDPELVRRIAEDATWQALLTELRSLAGDVTGREIVARGRARRVGAGGAHEHAYEQALDQPLPDVDGHGGQDVPPRGALTYRPSAQVTAIVRAMFATCTFPGCSVASTKCELDHQVPFNHAHPERGGWTIPANLQPLCKLHHAMKTAGLWSCVNLGGKTIRWRSATGIVRLTTATRDGPEPPPF